MCLVPNGFIRSVSRALSVISAMTFCLMSQGAPLRSHDGIEIDADAQAALCQSLSEPRQTLFLGQERKASRSTLQICEAAHQYCKNRLFILVTLIPNVAMCEADCDAAAEV
jgi:hypothetical protein